jgi:hypothetical protein
MVVYRRKYCIQILHIRVQSLPLGVVDLKISTAEFCSLKMANPNFQFHALHVSNPLKRGKESSLWAQGGLSWSHLEASALSHNT